LELQLNIAGALVPLVDSARKLIGTTKGLHMCELYVRALNIGLTVGDRFEMPLTQIVLGDALGLTPVHVNRVLRKLKVSGVMSLSRGSLVIADVAKLAIVAGFDDNYLHRRMRRPPAGREL
jgi:hypothetical protein